MAEIAGLLLAIAQLSTSIRTAAIFCRKVQKGEEAIRDASRPAKELKAHCEALHESMDQNCAMLTDSDKPLRDAAADCDAVASQLLHQLERYQVDHPTSGSRCRRIWRSIHYNLNPRLPEISTQLQERVVVLHTQYLGRITCVCIELRYHDDTC